MTCRHRCDGRKQPVSVLATKRSTPFYKHVKAKLTGPNLATASGRKGNYVSHTKVTRTKTAIDNAGKKLSLRMPARRSTLLMCSAGSNPARTSMLSLNWPALTDWEKQEEARVEYCSPSSKAIEDCGNGLIGGESYPSRILLRGLRKDRHRPSSEFEEQARVASHRDR